MMRATDSVRHSLGLQAADCCSVAISASGTMRFSEESNCRKSTGSAEKGTARSKSSSVHSGFSASINSGSGTFIPFSLLSACSSQADYPQGISAHCKNQSIEHVFDKSNRSNSNLSVLLAIILDILRRAEGEISNKFKAKPALPPVARALPRVERDLHTLNYRTKTVLPPIPCKICTEWEAK